MSRLPALLAIAVGATVGLAAYTFQFAKGLAYMSNDPAACANCHIMGDYLKSWQQSPHHVRAVCNDCHTPHSFFAKWITKADNGWNHSVKFTLGNFAEPIRLRPVNAVKLRDNCVACHRDIVSEIRHGRDEIECTRCHAGVGHGPRR